VIDDIMIEKANEKFPFNDELPTSSLLPMN
jgi:hypothetical protein